MLWFLLLESQGTFILFFFLMHCPLPSWCVYKKYCVWKNKPNLCSAVLSPLCWPFLTFQSKGKGQPARYLDFILCSARSTSHPSAPSNVIKVNWTRQGHPTYTDNTQQAFSAVELTKWIWIPDSTCVTCSSSDRFRYTGACWRTSLWVSPRCWRSGSKLK